MKKYRLFSVPIVLLLLVFIFSILPACAGEPSPSQNLYLRLYSTAQERLDQMKQDCARFEEAMSRKGEYEDKIAALKPKIVDCSGWWKFNEEELINMQDRNIDAKAVADMYIACKEINECNNEFNWCLKCETYGNELNSEIETIEKLMYIWDTGHKEWKTAEIDKGLSQVSGYGLGYSPGITTGNWHFNSTDNTSRPMDAAAEGIAQLLEKRQTYDELEKAAPVEKYNCIPPPATDRRTVDYWIIMQTRWSLKEGSSAVNSIFRQFPHVHTVWTQLAEIGYDLTFKGGIYIEVDKTTGEKQVTYYIQVEP